SSASLAAAWLVFRPVRGASLWIPDLAAGALHRSAAHPATVALYVIAVALLHDALALPLAWYRGFVLEHRYGLSSETRGAWAADHVKAAGVGPALGLSAAQAVAAHLAPFPG